jgi:hypothetical protein
MNSANSIVGEKKMGIKKCIVKTTKWTAIGLAGVILLCGLLVFYWWIRPNRSVVSQDLIYETWIGVSDGRHNSNTDMTFWKGYYYMIYASAPWHFASETTRLVLVRSTDARTWERIHEFQNPGEDIRDPKFAIIGDKLFIYFLKNKNFPEAEPYWTLVTASTDGVSWEPYSDVHQDGWLWWRPKSLDGKTWYVAAYWHEHGKSILLKSTDGYTWEKVSDIYNGDFNDETAIEFLKDGRMICTARLEVAGYYFGDNRGNTLIAVAEPPYTEWTTHHSLVTRLDGPRLFSYHDRIYAIGRYEPGPKFVGTGSILDRKRTSIFLVEEDRLYWLSDLPSAGDTSYPGVVRQGDDIYVCYYTSRTDRDFPWVLGMVSPSSIMMARVDMRSVESLALKALESPAAP